MHAIVNKAKGFQVWTAFKCQCGEHELSRPRAEIRVSLVSTVMRKKSLPPVQHPVTPCRVCWQRGSRPQAKI